MGVFFSPVNTVLSGLLNIQMWNACCYHKTSFLYTEVRHFDCGIWHKSLMNF